MQNNKFKKQADRAALIIVIPIAVCFAVYLFIQNQKDNRANLLNDFKGVVQNVSYDEKGIPSVSIKGIKYYLDAGYNFEHAIEQGDSLIKTKGQTRYILVKHNAKATFTFDN